MNLPRIAITTGDPAGVGPELCLRAMHDAQVRAQCVPVVFGDRSVLAEVARRVDLPWPVNTLSAAEFTSRPDTATTATIVDFACLAAGEVVPGAVSARTGRASYVYVEAAIEAALAGRVAAIVTGPIHKEAFHAAGVPYPGHTEMLADRTRCDRYAMMLTSDELTCTFVTSHVGLRDVPGLLSQERILEVIQLTDAAIRPLRGGTCRLVVCGLNPHAGEHGLFGAGEEEKIIAPAVESARQLGLDVVGPIAPDTAFVPAHDATRMHTFACTTIRG